MYAATAHVHVGILPVVFLMVAALGTGGSLRAQVAEVRRLDELKAAVQTEIRFLEAESLDGVQPLLAQLEELRDEVGYLRVVQRRGLGYDEGQCRAVEDRLGRLRDAIRRADARAQAGGLVGGAPEIPAEAELTVRLPDRLEMPGRAAEIGFDAVAVTELSSRGRVVVPVGAVLRGTLRRVDRPPGTDGRDGLVVALRALTVNGRTYAVDMQVIEAPAAAGGALTVESSEHGSVLTADGRAVALLPGALLRVRFESPLELTAD